MTGKIFMNVFFQIFYNILICQNMYFAQNVKWRIDLLHAFH